MAPRTPKIIARQSKTKKKSHKIKQTKEPVDQYAQTIRDFTAQSSHINKTGVTTIVVPDKMATKPKPPPNNKRALVIEADDTDKPVTNIGTLARNSMPLQDLSRFAELRTEIFLKGIDIIKHHFSSESTENGPTPMEKFVSYFLDCHQRYCFGIVSYPEKQSESDANDPEYYTRGQTILYLSWLYKSWIAAGMALENVNQQLTDLASAYQLEISVLMENNCPGS